MTHLRDGDSGKKTQMGTVSCCCSESENMSSLATNEEVAVKVMAQSATANGSSIAVKGSFAAIRAERERKRAAAESSSTRSILSSSACDDSSGGHHHLSAKESQSAGMVDSYGFLMTSEQKEEREKLMRSASYRKKVRTQQERMIKWQHMLEHWDSYTSTKKGKLKSRIRKGIPSSYRSTVWLKLMDVPPLTASRRQQYARLKSTEPAARFKSAIDNDLDRTFPTHVLFMDSSSSPSPSSSSSTLLPSTSSPPSSGKERLRNVLYAAANHDCDVGYTQGMGFIAALLLTLMTEEDAFWSLTALLDQNGKYQLRGLYLDGLPLLINRYYQLSGLLHQFIPRVWSHLESQQIKPALYGSKWFITIFCYEFPFEFVYRIWDCFLSEGIKLVFRVCLAMIKMNEAQILKISDFEPLMKFMQSIHSPQHGQIQDIDSLLQKAFDLPLKHEHLSALQAKYDRMRLQKQRQSRKQRRGGGDVSAMDKQPQIVQRLSMEAQRVSIDALQSRTGGKGTAADHSELDDDDNDSGSELNLSADADHQSAPLIAANGDKEPDLHFEPKSPSEPDLNFKPKEAAEEKKEEDADCRRYDEGSHSESSQMHSTSSDLPEAKEHRVILPDDVPSEHALNRKDAENEIENEHQDLLQKESAPKAQPL